MSERDGARGGGLSGCDRVVMLVGSSACEGEVRGKLFHTNIHRNGGNKRKQPVFSCFPQNRALALHRLKESETYRCE